MGPRTFRCWGGGAENSWGSAGSGQFAPRDIWQSLETFLVPRAGRTECTEGFWWVEARDAAELLQGPGQPHNKESDSPKCQQCPGKEACVTGLQGLLHTRPAIDGRVIAKFLPWRPRHMGPAQEEPGPGQGDLLTPSTVPPGQQAPSNSHLRRG